MYQWLDQSRTRTQVHTLVATFDKIFTFLMTKLRIVSSFLKEKNLKVKPWTLNQTLQG